MPKVDHTLTWAVPVRPDEIGAHLEAYAKTLPVINTLRLCNRFGAGPGCYINKLPTELVQGIEELIKESAREEPKQAWSRQLRCYEDTCDAIDDHYTQEEQYEFYHEYYGCRMSKKCSQGKCDCEGPHKCVPRCPVSQNTPQAKQRIRDSLQEGGELDEEIDNWIDRHHEAMDDLETKVNALQRLSNPVKEEQRLLLEHFGLRLWAPEIRQPSDVFTMPDHAFVAYLTLPDSTTRQQGQIESEHESCAMPVQIGALPTEKSLHRFPRAMKILDIEPYVDRQLKDTQALCPVPSKAEPAQDDDEVKESERGKSGKSGKAKFTATPQLMLLARSTGEYHEWWAL